MYHTAVYTAVPIAPSNRFGPSWADTVFGGRRLEVASNIVWSNGDLDPWARLGVTTSLSPSLKAVVIPVWGGEGGLL